MIRRSTNELSIKPKMARTTQVQLYLVGLVLIASALYGAFWYGGYSSDSGFKADKLSLESLREEISDLEQKLKTAEDDLIFAERQKQIQEEAYKQISAAYANSERKNRELVSNLDFYRSIISPENNQSGAAIQKLEHSLSQGQINFDVTLVQAIKHKSQIRGQLRVQAYLADELVGQWPSASGRSVSYQYFTRVSGTIDSPRILPESEDKIRLLVTLDRADDEPLTRWFDLNAEPED